MKTVKVIVKPVGKIPHIEWIDNELKAFQKIVGGYIETVSFTTDVCVICDEEGRLKGLPHNCVICGVEFVGDVVVVGTDGEEFADIPMSLEAFKKYFLREEAADERMERHREGEQ